MNKEDSPLDLFILRNNKRSPALSAGDKKEIRNQRGFREDFFPRKQTLLEQKRLQHRVYYPRNEDSSATLTSFLESPPTSPFTKKAPKSIDKNSYFDTLTSGSTFPNEEDEISEYNAARVQRLSERKSLIKRTPSPFKFEELEASFRKIGELEDERSPFQSHFSLR